MPASPILRDEFEHEVHEMILTIVMAIAVAIVCGICLGATVVVCIQQCSKKNQKSRLTEAQNQGNNFVFNREGTEIAEMTTTRNLDSSSKVL